MRRLRNRLMSCDEGTSTLENRVLLAALSEVSGDHAPATADDSPATLELTAGDNALLQELHDVSEQTGNEYLQAFYATSMGLSKAETTVTETAPLSSLATFPTITDVVAHTHPTVDFIITDKDTIFINHRGFSGNLNPSEPVAPSNDLHPLSENDFAFAIVYAEGKYNGYVSLVQHNENRTHGFVPSQRSIALGKELGFEELKRQLVEQGNESRLEKILEIRNRDGGKRPSEFTQAEENEVILAGALGMAELAKGSYYVGISGAAEGGGTTLLKLTEENLREIAELLAESNEPEAAPVEPEAAVVDQPVADKTATDAPAANEPVKLEAAVVDQPVADETSANAPVTEETVTDPSTDHAAKTLDQVSGDNTPATVADSPEIIEITAADTLQLQELHDVSEQTGTETPQAFYATSTGLSKAATTVNETTVNHFAATFPFDTDVAAHTHPAFDVVIIYEVTEADNIRDTTNAIEIQNRRFAGNLNPAEPLPLSRDLNPLSPGDILQATLHAGGFFNGFVSLVQQTEKYTHAFVPSKEGIAFAKGLGREEFSRQLLDREAQARGDKVVEILNRDGGKSPAEFTQAERNEVMLAGAIATAELAQGSYYVGISGALEDGGTTLAKVTEENLREMAHFLVHSDASEAAVADETVTAEASPTVLS